MGKYTKEFLISEMQRFYKANGTAPRCVDFQNKEYPNYKTYQNHFGSWNNALIKAGLQKTLEFNNYTKQDMLDIGLEYYNKTNKIPSVTDLKFSYSVVYKYWEDWDNYLIDIGLHNDVTTEYTKEELILFLIDLKEKLGRNPTTQDFIKLKCSPSLSPYRRVFGSFQNALYEARLITKPLTSQEKIDISMQNIIKYYNHHGHPPSAREYETIKGDGYERKALERKLKMSYGDIICNYIIEAVNPFSVTKEDITQDLINMSKIKGRPPMATELIDSELLGYSLTVILNRFNNSSYNNILREIGLTPIGADALPYTEDEMLSLFEKLFIELKRIPYTREIDRCDYTPSYSTYKKHFGDIENVCKLLDIDYEKHYKGGGAGRICFDKEGGLCKSVAEKNITNYLLDEQIIFYKETPYSELITNERESNPRRFDWKVIANNNVYYIEYFGMYDKKPRGDIGRRYVKRTRKKIKDLYKAGVVDKCIFIFPYDLENKTLDDIFAEYIELNGSSK